MAPPTFWPKCLEHLQTQTSVQDFNTWIRPLQAQQEGNQLVLLAPNRFVLDWIQDKLLNDITHAVECYAGDPAPTIRLDIGTRIPDAAPAQRDTQVRSAAALPQMSAAQPQPTIKRPPSNLNPDFTFDTYVVGESNKYGYAACMSVGENLQNSYNPLVIYGGVGLGKTHLMHAVGNKVLKDNPNARILYLHSERFVTDMVKALQRNAMDEFKRFYRTADVLLIDDVQFFARKDRSQEELFHTMNALLDARKQIILTSDRYPKELDGLEERLKSRFSWGLTVGIEPPELETRVAILVSKAEQSHVELPQEVAFFIAEKVNSNVRELEGALKRVIANSQFTGAPITIDFAKTALKDLLSIQAKQVGIDNIQKVVAKYYQLRVSDLLSKRRNRSITRPRQLAMWLAKALTSLSLPEIGDAFGGRDHTTVLHACRKIAELCETDLNIKEDRDTLMRILST